MTISAYPQPKKWPEPIRALAHKSFQIYFLGQGVSTLGKWMQQVALAWLAYHLSGSAVLLGTITFLALLPQLILGPVAGAWMDRHDKRKLLMLLQILLSVQSASMAALTWLHWMSSEIIVLMALLLGLLNAVETPLRQALIGNFVDDRSDLPNALVLNSMLINASRFVGPPLAGWLIHWSGEFSCFLLNSLAFAALLLGLRRVKSPSSRRALGSTQEIFREGLGYLWNTHSVRQVLLSVVTVNLLASCYSVLLPILAKDVFSGSSQTMGMLWGAAGAGAFLATLYLAFSAHVSSSNHAVRFGVLLCMLALFGVAAGSALPFSMIALAVLGFGITISNVSSNMLLQSQAPEAMRGRVIAFYIAMRFGFEAVGGLFAGLVAHVAGTQYTFALFGLLLAVYWLSNLRANAGD